MALIPFPSRAPGTGRQGMASPLPLSALAPGALARLIRDALRHLYDPVYLETHALAPYAQVDGSGPASLASAHGRPTARASAGGAAPALALPRANPSVPISAGAALRRDLLDAIAALEPALPAAAGPGAGGGERVRRRHRLLVLRYVEGLDIPAICRQLAISRREYEREHKQGIDAIAALLRRRWEEPRAPEAEGRAPLPPPSVGQAAVGQGPPQHGGSRAPADVPPATAERARAAGLPLPLTSFVGREREAAEVARL